MKQYIWKRVACLVLSAVMALPVTALAREEREEPEEDLLAFSGAVSDMIREYGLEAPAGDVGLADAELEEYASGRLIVKAAGEIDPLDALSVAEGYDDLHVLQFADAAAAKAACETYWDMDGVEYVQPDVIYEGAGQPAGERPAEEDVSLLETEYQSWGYGSDYMNMESYKTWLEDTVSRRPGIVVAVTDTGVMADHEFLQGRVLTNGYDFVNNDADPDDDYGHGTHVSGTVVDGTLDNVKILPIKVLNENNSGTSLQIAMGIRYAVQQGADIINMSLGGTGMNYLEKEAIDEAVEAGITVVVSAGNDNADAGNKSPACFDNVICVAATDGYERSSFSNYGDVVDVTAPGDSIKSSIPYEEGAEEWERYDWWNGTSMAAPHISAAAAMLLSAHQTYTPAQVKLRLEQAATYEIDQLGSDWYGEGGDGHPVPNMPVMSALVDGPADQDTMVSISRTEAYACYGQTFRLDVVSNQGSSSVTWSSSNKTVASVNGSGVVTCGSKSGTAVISATVSGKKVSCTVTVRPLELTAESAYTLPLNGSTRFLCETNCDPAPALTWSTSDASTVKLYPYADEDGNPLSNDMTTTAGMMAEGLKEGTTDVTVGFGSVKETIRVTVKAPGSWYDPAADVYHIRTKADLLEFAAVLRTDAVEDYMKGKTVYLEADIDLTGTKWAPVSEFAGTFDGQNHTISNMDLAGVTGNYDGFFGYLDETAVIRDLNVTGEVSTTETMDRIYMGGIAAYNLGSIENCSFTGTVSAPNRPYVGGIAGYSKGEILNCTADADVLGQKYVGGIVGYAVCSDEAEDIMIDGCESRGDVESLGDYAGGIAGYADMPILNSGNEGTVAGQSDVGGIAGGGADLLNCINRGAVFGASYLGGIAGTSWGEAVMDCINEGSVTQTDETVMYGNAGGIVGNLGGEYYSITHVRFCDNYGDVSGMAGVGGIVGSAYGSEEAPLTDCSNYGDISGTDNVGGIAGEYCDSTIYSCVNDGYVTGEGNVGGLVGYLSSGELSHSVNRGDVSATGRCAGGLVGYLSYGTCKNCANFGVTTASQLCGKLVGEVYSYDNDWSRAEVSNCYTNDRRNVQLVAEYKDDGSFVTHDVVTMKAQTRNGETVYTLDYNVTAADYYGNDLLEAMNHCAAYAYTEEDVIEREEWEDEVYENLTYKARRPCFWTCENGILMRACGIGARSASGGDYEYLGILPWEMLDYEDSLMLAARYNGGKMTAADELAWSEDWLLTADLVGGGDLVRLFLLDGGCLPLCAPLEFG